MIFFPSLLLYYQPADIKPTGVVVNGLYHGLTDRNGYVYESTCFLVYFSPLARRISLFDFIPHFCEGFEPHVEGLWSNAGGLFGNFFNVNLMIAKTA